MKRLGSVAAVTAALMISSSVTIAHDIGDRTHNPHPNYDRSVRPPATVPVEVGGVLEECARYEDFFAVNPVFMATIPPGQNELAMAIAEAFRPFAPSVKIRWDDNFFYVESDGYPAHRMMVGITAWQQQVPISQRYTGENAWRFPLRPVVAKMPLSAKDHFFRGAIAIAVNGVPIFNPIKNDGRTDTFLAGELDEFGGHAGRADDYHYHIAPLHLQKTVGNGKPIAYALDGYPILGLTEADGSAVSKLDVFNGHADAAGKYHYHSTKSYPYINGGFHGDVIERDGQVDPQPRAFGVRPSTEPLKGAKIIDFVVNRDSSVTLSYTVNGESRRIIYAVQKDGGYRFEYIDGDGRSRVENYAGANGNRERRDGPRRDQQGDGKRIPWIVQHAGEMDGDRDGVLTQTETEAEIERAFKAYDRNGDGKIDASETEAGNVRSALGGFVRQHFAEIDSDTGGSLSKAELAATVMKMFGRADRDGDGKLSKDETKEATPLERPKKQ